MNNANFKLKKKLSVEIMMCFYGIFCASKIISEQTKKFSF